MKNKYHIYWNIIELYFSSPNEEQNYIKEDFDYKSKTFVITNWVNSLLQLESNDIIKQNIIYYNIIRELNDYSKSKDLDYLQKLDINWTRCWIIDNWNDICLMLPSEY